MSIFGSREILTLQLGTLSNCVGAHFWNLQQTYFEKPTAYVSSIPKIFLEDVLFSDIEHSFKPRLLSVDWRDSLHFELSTDYLPPLEKYESSLWDGTVTEVVRSGSNQPTDLSAPLWSSCLTPPLQHAWLDHDITHTIPRSEATFKVSSGGGDIILSDFFQGLDVMRPGKAIADDLEDGFRREVERCSLLNGVQLFVDGDGIFAGVAARLLDYMDDEIPKRSLLSFPIYDSEIMDRLNKTDSLRLKASQLALLVHLEPPASHVLRGSWIPFAFKPPTTARSCLDSSLIAATLDAITTWPRLIDSHGGVSLEEFIAATQHLHGKRMLSARIHYHIESIQENHIAWKSFSPYLTLNGSQVSLSNTILWRQFTTRGLPTDRIEPLLKKSRLNGITQAVPMSDESTEFMLPGMQSGAEVRLVTAASDIPMKPPINMSTKRPWCGQPSSIRAVSILDTPGPGSDESLGLRNLVTELLKTSTHPPFDEVERDVWREYLETARTYLIDAYSEEATSDYF